MKSKGEERLFTEKKDYSLAANEYGWWKIDGGKVNFDFTGAVEYNSAYYTVVNGKVVF